MPYQVVSLWSYAFYLLCSVNVPLVTPSGVEGVYLTYPRSGS